MKLMKNLFILASLAGFLCLFNGCSDDDDNVTNNYPELAIGKWVVTNIDGITPLTDSLFCMELRSDKAEIYSIGTRIDANNSKWVEGDNYIYTINNDIITINGIDQLNKTVTVELKIQELTSTTFTYSVKSYVYDGISTPDSHVYTCKKASVDYATQIIGVWYGKCTSDNTADTNYHYWEYLANGNYNYYYQDDANNWIKKSDNEGKYFLYGNLFVSNYLNDLQSGTTGMNYECWNISINNTKMNWTALRTNNKTVTYEMDKVEAAPPTNK